MVWVNFGERPGVGYSGWVVERCFSSPHYNIYLPKNTCNGKCQTTRIVRAKPRLKALFGHIFMRNISAPLTEWNCSRRVCMKHLIFFQSHYGHLIVLEGLTEMIVTFSFWWSITPYIPSRPSIFLKSEIQMFKEY